MQCHVSIEASGSRGRVARLAPLMVKVTRKAPTLILEPQGPRPADLFSARTSSHFLDLPSCGFETAMTLSFEASSTPKPVSRAYSLLDCLDPPFFSS